MKRLILAVSIILAGMGLKAQHNHFIYLQTDNRQAFYVRVNDNLYSSSAAGYLVIPKLQKGNYSLQIGFPKNEWPQQTIPVTIKNGDLGFMLKNFGEKGWGLFNIQSLDVTMAAQSADAKSNTRLENKTDDFSNVLAGVVNTPSLKQVSIETPTARPESERAKSSVDTPAGVMQTTDTIADNRFTTQKDREKMDSVILLSSALDNSGRSVVYLVPSGTGTDTIRIFIPYDNTSIAAEPKQVPDTPKTVIPVDSTIINTVVNVREEPIKATEPEKKVIPATDDRFLNIELPNPNTKQDTTGKQIIGVKDQPSISDLKPEMGKTQSREPLKPLMINSDCKVMATEEDFLKTRKKMASGDNDDEMIAAARKSFKSKCYSTEQVKNLGMLFLADEGRYKFFDAAYPFVHDSYNFDSLEKQLTVEYYINRFKAMIRH